MGLFNNMKNAVVDINRTGKESRKQEETYTLQTLKQSSSVELATIDNNKYLRAWHELELQSDLISRKAIVVDLAKSGKVPIYNLNVFNDKINTIIDTLTDEVFANLSITISKINDDGEEELIEVEEVSRQDIELTLILNPNAFKLIFEYLYLYDKCAVKVNIVDGVMQIEVLKPYQYKYNGSQALILSFNANEYSVQERLKAKDGTVTIDGVESNDMFFYEFNMQSNFFNKLETLFSYDLINSALVKETQINLSKMFIDKKAWKSNPVNNEVINLIDVPEGLKIGEDSRSSYMQTVAGSNTLDSIGFAKREMEQNIVNIFGLSKKTLGLDSSGQDFASSLPYENDLTAKTVNSLRGQMSDILNELIFMLTNQTIIVDFGRYSLESEEAKIDQNQKALQSKQRSINSAVANLKGKQLDDEEVVRETLTIKIENNMTLTLEDEIMAGQMGLLPSLVGVDELDGMD